MKNFTWKEMQLFFLNSIKQYYLYAKFILNQQGTDPTIFNYYKEKYILKDCCKKEFDVNSVSTKNQQLIKAQGLV